MIIICDNILYKLFINNNNNNNNTLLVVVIKYFENYLETFFWSVGNHLKSIFAKKININEMKAL